MNGGRESRRPRPALGCSAIDDDDDDDDPTEHKHCRVKPILKQVLG
jgi:hypothetical protein